MRVDVPKYQACLLAIAAILVLFSPTSCRQNVSSSPLTTATSQDISAHVIQALSQVTAFTLETDLTDAEGPPADSVAATYEWRSTKSFDIPGQTMQITMTISDEHFEWDIVKFLTGGWLYAKNSYTGTVSTNVPPWIKQMLSNADQAALLSQQDQLGYYSELLATATKVDLAGDETIGNTDCYVLEVTPSFQGMLDWLHGQNGNGGPVIAIRMDGLAFERTDTYQQGALKLWINKSTYLPVRAELKADYQGFMGEPMIPTLPYTPTDNPYQENYTATVSFSDIGSPFVITLPGEAVSAPEVT
jgi:hypothetical protein